MRTTLSLLAVLVAAPVFAQLPKPTASDLKTPESVAIGVNGKVYVSNIGEFGKDGDGSIVIVENGESKPFAAGLDDPKGMGFFQQTLFVADKTRVWKIGPNGKPEVFAAAEAFPIKPLFLNDLAVDPESGFMFVSDSGDTKGKGGAVFRISPRGKVDLVINAEKLPEIHTPNGVLLDGQSHLLLADFGTGNLYRIKLVDKSVEKIAEGLGAADGLAWDSEGGRLYVSDWKGGKVFGIARPGLKPVLMAEGFGNAADICFDLVNRKVLVPDMKNGTLTALAPQIPGFEVDESPLPLKTEIAFPNLEWTGWKGETDSGKPNPLRPILLTHFGDGSNRVVVPTQHGVVHVFPNDQNASKTTIFLDIQDRVSYRDDQNEEGFLGLAFHPKFKENGEFFVFYTPKKFKQTNIVSRFRVSKDDPSKADPASEEEILRFSSKPFWNHDGGTICFGPDGFLYITHGDGGAANDPYDNGQKMSTWYGKVLRIDVDKKDKGLNYAIPPDNPFAGAEGVKPEIWALGLRNIWRMSFDRKTGKLWAGEVGQNLWEEIIIVTKGGNYGWNRRESFHPFGVKGQGVKPEFVEPIWEYHHDVGKSITGGHVYRGSQFPELDGHFLYADYVSGKIWALKFDEDKGRVVANRRIKDNALPIMSFGEDEKGELYLMYATPTGKGLYRISR